MIDIHSHILPSIDDGAATLSVSIEMLDAARRLGFHTIVATPHLLDRLSPDYDRNVRNTHLEIESEARVRDITLLRGFEVRLVPDLPGRLRAGEPITLNDGKIVLVDLPFIQWPHYTDSTLFEIQAAGFLPVLAHPERYPEVQRDPSSCVALASRGIGLQLTIGSFSGAFGKSSRRAAESLLELGAAHLVATDAHSAGHRMAAVPAGLRRLNELVGLEGIRQLLDVGPQMLLGGQLPPSVSSGKRSWLSRIRRSN